MKRGSALLIVLGMMAFVVISAIAFSAYMRYARMPSSFLRRTSSSRLLAKAALAEAIDIIDASIGNSAYPGKTGRQQIKDYRRITDEDRPADVIDYWQDRCFIGSNQLVSVESTVSTLCTEALAYIPPPIVNEVRYYSRRSVAGQWHTLGFDSGRFAFAAVDVSDFFDVNSVRANPSDIQGKVIYGRNSSDCGRITLSHVFENESHTGHSTLCTPDAWDDFMDKYLAVGKVPLVSLADLALAMHKQGLDDKMNPFCNYILNGANFVRSETGPEAELVRNMTFVTDSLFAITNRVVGRGLNLAAASDQPFYGAGDISGESQISARRLLSGGNNAFTRYMESPRSNFNNDPEYVQLLDYLDGNSVPATLALPTVERTPMIVGVALEGEMALQIEKGEEIVKEATEGTVKVRYYATPYTLKLNGQLKVDAGTVYPFKHERGGEKQYQLQAAVSLAFVPECVPESEGLLRCNRATAPAIVSCNDNWQGVGDNWAAPELASAKKAVLLCRSNSVNVPYNKDPKTEQEAAGSDDVEVSLPAFGGFQLATELPETSCYPAGMKCTFRKCRKVKVVMVDGHETEVPDASFTDAAPVDRVGALPVEKDLSAAIAADKLADTTYIPTIQVWVRIYNGNDTVDLVPACWRDDKEPADILQDDARGSSQYPFLRFRLGNGIKFDFSQGGGLTETAQGTTTLLPQAYLTDDPRFNYAPENFIALSGADAQGEFKDLWIKRQRSGDANRDGDIFMATSDAGYLQSVYELTHLVATTRGGDGYGLADGSGYNGNARTDFSGCPANEAMWRTYSQYDGGWAKNDIDGLDVINGTRGFRVNPYTESPDIMLAALANSPLDWWAASTNETVNNTVHGSASSAAKYSFSKLSGAKVQLEHGNLKAIAKNMVGRFRDPGSTADWRRVFDELGWDGGTAENGGDTLCGVTLDNDVKLHSVDRKFLHGFWKECLAYRQQLFLVFVRAEPMMMGGGGLGQTPPQLGARAVALVWRDPTATDNDVGGTGTGNGPRPHRTRILLYRQFD